MLKRPELITDPRFLTNSDRLANIAELEPLLEAEFAQADAATWIARCEQAQVPCGPINDFGQAMQDPHYAARGMIQELDHPRLGRMKTVGIPSKFSRTPGQLRRPAPLHGEHTDEVLARFGVSPERIAQWREQGVVQ
ncbi:L-carnitine dehydrogenase-like protein [Bordetella trematum]|nr:L-carnitine dehydrogenase-like protein [Bordetella trematum]